MNNIDAKRKFFLGKLISRILHIRLFRKLILTRAENMARDFIYNNEEPLAPFKAREDCVVLTRNLFRSIYRAFDKGIISHKYLSNLVRAMALAGQPRPDQLKSFKERYGLRPPLFLLLSPTQRCNLKCPGCYANCDQKQKVTMDFDTVKRILTEKRDSWGSHFTVISGGEPFMYQSQGKNIIDIFKLFPDTLYLVYTNGTLIDEEMAEQLAELGNVTPAISVEGFARQTDERRGKGVFEKVLRSMNNLRKAGVMFGLSVTVTSANVDFFISNFDEFAGYFMDNLGAIFVWMFQYMPIGRDHDTLSLMVPPDKRKALYDKTWQMVREKEHFIADFWNSGTVSGGCIAAGRGDGFLYIDWNGNVMPCVFNPYYNDNIHDVYNNNGHLDDVLFSPLMKKLRQWQIGHYYNTDQPNEQTKKSILTCCPLKDHFRHTYKILKEVKVKYSNPEAKAAFGDEKYYQDMVKYGDESRRFFDEVWQREYMATHKELLKRYRNNK